MNNDLEKLSLRKFKIKSILPDATILILGKRRSGKSLSYGTKILMHDGSVKVIENIKVGDTVMGDDSTPRNVLEIHSGIDKMYSIIHNNGDTYKVNSHHILSLKWIHKKTLIDNYKKKIYQIKYFNDNDICVEYKNFIYTNDIDKKTIYVKAKHFFDSIEENPYVDIPIEEYINLNSYYKESLQGYFSPLIEFKECKTQYEPYDIGYWLFYNNFMFKSTHENFNNKFRNILFNRKINKTFGNFENIPKDYLINDKENRLKLLAGIIDGNHNLNTKKYHKWNANKNTNNKIQITCVKNTDVSLIDDIVFLIKSLGFKCEKSLRNDKNYIINLYGDINNIPLKNIKIRDTFSCSNKTLLTSKINIIELPEDKYFGIELDGNNRFVLDNFIVTHNSFLARDIFFNHKNIPSGVVFSGTEEASPFFGDFIPDCFIHSEYNPDIIEGMMNRQKRKIREAKAKGLSESGKHPSNNKFIVLDDMLHDAQNWKREKTIKSIFFNGRHYNFLFILTMQYPLGITPELRSNIDYVFIFNEQSIKNKKKIYEDYGAMIPTFDHFCNILDACTQNHECLVIKTSGNSADIREQVFWYKAEAHTNFHAGHPKFWKYHSKNYNENYEEDDDKDNIILENIKKNFAKTKKLKVIVSRQGDIIGYKEDN